MKGYLLILAVLIFGANLAEAGSRGGSSSSFSSASKTSTFSSASKSAPSSFKSAPITKAPSVTKGMAPSIRPTTPLVVEHHYYGSDNGSGHFLTNMLLFSWLLHRDQPQTLIVNGQPQQVAQGSYVTPSDHSTGDKFMIVLIWVFILGTVGYAIWHFGYRRT